MTKIAPSILAADLTRLGDQVKLAERSGADWIHVDIMDGAFVPNITFGPLIVRAVRRCTTLPIDVHLMIEEPSRYVPEFAEAGADWITVHVEACPHLYRDLQHIHDQGKKAGVTLNPGTPIEKVFPVLEVADMVLIMSVNPGFGGQKFIPSAVQRIATVARQVDRCSRPIEISVDGGINEETSPLVREAGATVLVTGSAFYGLRSNHQQFVRDLRGES